MAMNLPIRFLCAGLALAAMAAVAPVSAAQPDRVQQAKVKQKLVEYAQSRVDEKVGSGHCSELVSAALEAAGGRAMTHVTHRMPDGKKFVPLTSYAWGQRVVSLGKRIQPVMPTPGSIVQFEDCYFSGEGYEFRFPHHTAIVEGVEGTMVTLLHQHSDGSIDNAKVTRQAVDFSTRSSGHYFVYYPLPK